MIRFDFIKGYDVYTLNNKREEKEMTLPKECGRNTKGVPVFCQYCMYSESMLCCLFKRSLKEVEKNKWCEMLEEHKKEVKAND